MLIELIFIWMASLWWRGLGEVGNGLFIDQEAYNAGEPTISSAGELDSGKPTLRRNDRNSDVKQGL